MGPTFRLKVQVSGNSIPCSFPDRSLFRLVSEIRFSLPTHCVVWSYLGWLGLEGGYSL